ncbi:uncharacterized protein JCM6883_003816 [Sporobolomyces salmoneus]|uniref:uncharacterized protein n=1 Tax=Sporobolomyces salmoneus TaxID=183962 RepID=UPI00317D008F
MQIGARQYVPIEHSLALQLDCIVADQVYPVSRQVANVDRPILDDSLAYPVPFLLDLGFHESTSWWGTPSSSLDPTLSYAHVQIRVDVEGGRTTPRRSHVKMALELVEDLLAHSTALKELYLDFDGRPGRIGYDLHGKSEEAEEIRKIEDQAGKKNVEIIWESRQDDWCRSLGSKEFWRRCKKKREQKEGVEAR